MTDFEKDRQKADARYVAARRALEVLTPDCDAKVRAQAYLELEEAHKDVTRFARQAGIRALAEQEAK